MEGKRDFRSEKGASFGGCDFHLPNAGHFLSLKIPQEEALLDTAETQAVESRVKGGRTFTPSPSILPSASRESFGAGSRFNVRQHSGYGSWFMAKRWILL